MKKEYQNKVYKIAPDSYIVIPRMKFFKNRNLSTKIQKDKRKKSRKKEKQDFLLELREQGIL